MRLLLRSWRALESVSVSSDPPSYRAFHLALRDTRVRIASAVWSTATLASFDSEVRIGGCRKGFANFGFKSGTRIIELLVSL